jgi:hypothetical protein
VFSVPWPLDHDWDPDAEELVADPNCDERSVLLASALLTSWDSVFCDESLLLRFAVI